MRRITAFALALGLLSGLAACGDPIEDYCQDVKEHRKEFNQMVDAGTQYGLITHLPMLQELAGAAPDDLTDEWQSFLTSIEGLDAAVKASGHKVSDFSDGEMPAGLSVAQKQKIEAAAGRMSGPETVAAALGIDQQARDVCKVNLGR